MLILYREKIITGSFIFKHCQYNQHVIVIAINTFIVSLSLQLTLNGKEMNTNTIDAAFLNELVLRW